MSLAQDDRTARPTGAADPAVPARFRSAVDVAQIATLCLLFPLAWMHFSVLAVGQTVAYQVRRQLLRKENAEDHLGIETTLALVAIPIIGLVGTVGTSWAFYIWALGSTEPLGVYCAGTLCGGPSQTGRAILFITLAICIIAIWVSSRMLAGHASGRRVFPFQPDVNPELALAALAEEEAAKVVLVLPSVRREARRIACSRTALDRRVRPLGAHGLRIIFGLGVDWWRVALVVIVGTGVAFASTYLPIWENVDTWQTRCLITLLFAGLSTTSFFLYQWSSAANFYLDAVRMEFRKQQLLERITAEAKAVAIMEADAELLLARAIDRREQVCARGAEPTAHEGGKIMCPLRAASSDAAPGAHGTLLTNAAVLLLGAIAGCAVALARTRRGRR